MNFKEKNVTVNNSKVAKAKATVKEDTRFAAKMGIMTAASVLLLEAVSHVLDGLNKRL